MDIFVVFSLFFAVIFLPFAVAFLAFPENSCNLISGFNTKSHAERQAYDVRRLGRETGLLFLLCTAGFLLGAFGCELGYPVSLIAAIAIACVLMLAYVKRCGKGFARYLKK